jgi:hypothetical protein
LIGSRCARHGARALRGSDRGLREKKPAGRLVDASRLSRRSLCAPRSDASSGGKGHAADAATRFSIADFKAFRFSDVPAYLQQTETHLFSGLRKAGIKEN